MRPFSVVVSCTTRTPSLCRAGIESYRITLRQQWGSALERVKYSIVGSECGPQQKGAFLTQGRLLTWPLLSLNVPNRPRSLMCVLHLGSGLVNDMCVVLAQPVENAFEILLERRCANQPVVSTTE